MTTSHPTLQSGIVRNGGDEAQFSEGSREPFWCTLLCVLVSLLGAVASASLLAAAVALLLQFPLLAKIRNFRLFIAKTLNLELLGENCVHVSMCVCTSVHWKEEDRIF